MDPRNGLYSSEKRKSFHACERSKEISSDVCPAGVPVILIITYSPVALKAQR
jgi:hypothetical protein